jgi:hypothetical protein
MAPSLSLRSISSASFSHLKPHLAKAYLALSDKHSNSALGRQYCLCKSSVGDFPESLPTLEEGDRRAFLCVMLEELNNKFTLQQDQCPITDRSSQSSSESPSADTISAVLAGGAGCCGLGVAV